MYIKAPGRMIVIDTDTIAVADTNTDIIAYIQLDKLLTTAAAANALYD